MPLFIFLTNIYFYPKSPPRFRFYAIISPIFDTPDDLKIWKDNRLNNITLLIIKGPQDILKHKLELLFIYFIFRLKTAINIYYIEVNKKEVY